MQKMIQFLKDEVVLTVAIVLAAISAFIITPDAQYISYIDFRTLAILFCLMAVMVGLQDVGVFKKVANALLAKVHTVTGVVFILVLLCFFSSMLITNDVALITFVPLALLILSMANMNDSLCYIMTLMTIAARGGMHRRLHIC